MASLDHLVERKQVWICRDKRIGGHDCVAKAGRLKPKQIVVAAMRKLLALCFGVLKTGRPFDAAIAMGG